MFPYFQGTAPEHGSPCRSLALSPKGPGFTVYKLCPGQPQDQAFPTRGHLCLCRSAWCSAAPGLELGWAEVSVPLAWSRL